MIRFTTNILLATVIMLFIVACTTSKKEESITDSTTQKTDTVSQTPAVVIIEVEPPIDINATDSPEPFPYSSKLFTDEEQEANLIQLLDTIMAEYNAGKFVTIKSNYTVNYEVGNDYDDATEEVSLSEENIWYFDINRHLSAYTRVIISKDKTDSTIFLLENEQVIAAFRNRLLGGQDLLITKDRMLTSACPDCGIQLTTSFTNYSTSPLNDSYVSEVSDELFKEYDQLKYSLHYANIVKNTAREYTLQKKFFLYDKYPYTVTYSISSLLYKKFIAH